MTKDADGIPAWATWGLLAAWTVHDAEELATMSRFSRKSPAWLPELDQTHVTTAIGLMGGLVAAASAAGARTGGRSRFYQAVLVGFGFHAVSHVASAVVLRRYTPGLVTAPLVVAPFSLLAVRALRARGVELTAGPESFGWLPVAIGGVHGAAVLFRRAGRLALRRARVRGATR